MEIINTGNLKRIEHENTEDVKVNKLFQGVFGVGGLLRLLLNPPLHLHRCVMLCVYHASHGSGRGEDSIHVV